LTARKRLTELELSIVQCQHEVEIPLVQLDCDLVLINLAKEKKKTAASMSLATWIQINATEYLQNSTFLNSLQQRVNGWLKEIQTLTHLSQSEELESAQLVGQQPTLSVSYEMSFWNSLEKHLLQVEHQLQDENILMTLELLKVAKRYHVTVSFLSDTGLKEAIEKVQKYNVLLKVSEIFF
jgi:dynein heavy chain 1